MPLRLGFLCLLLAIASALAGDGIPPRGSAEDYPVHQISGKVAIGAAYVPPAQVRKLLGEDLDKRGYVVFEVGVFPIDSKQLDVSADDFKLMQGKDTGIVRAGTPHSVAADVWPTPTAQPKTPGNVAVQSTETIGYQSGPYGHGVYTDSRVGVGVGKDPAVPPPAAPPVGNQAGLEQQLEEKSLPETKTTKAVAGYVFFPKPSRDKRADFELLYFGLDGQISLKLSPSAKP
jgi:hypothetical protein